MSDYDYVPSEEEIIEQADDLYRIMKPRAEEYGPVVSLLACEKLVHRSVCEIAYGKKYKDEVSQKILSDFYKGRPWLSFPSNKKATVKEINEFFGESKALKTTKVANPQIIVFDKILTALEKKKKKKERNTP